MLLHYFKKKENIENTIAINQYKKILKISLSLLNENYFFKKKDYNISFEIVSIFLIMMIQINLKNKNLEKYKKINEYLISIFISDLDESLREKGIGDMSIGKYVKSYVKKFYFRLKKFPKKFNSDEDNSLVNYLNKINLLDNPEDHLKVSLIFKEKYKFLLNL